jgi:hypothetical protein
MDPQHYSLHLLNYYSILELSKDLKTSSVAYSYESWGKKKQEYGTYVPGTGILINSSIWVWVLGKNDFAFAWKSGPQT